MKLAFNAVRSGMGPNGGSNTVFKSARTLEKLGHCCDVIANVDNFNWFEHKPVIRSVPEDLDAIINVAAVDYQTTRYSKVPIKACWWRAHEVWANSEEYLINCYRDKTVMNFVNSCSLQKQLLNYGAESKVIYQGIDFDLWHDMELRPKNKIRIGCLYTKQPRKRWKDFVKLSNILGTKDYEYVGLGNAVPKDNFLSNFKCNVGPDELRKLYSSCHIWFAPTDSEGLHNPPMEAALCGCLVVCSNHPLNGMVYDYAFENTAMIYEEGNIKQAAALINNPNWGLIDTIKNVIKDRIGSREKNMINLIKCLEKFFKNG